jgi:hypothetical protein
MLHWCCVVITVEVRKYEFFFLPEHKLDDGVFTPHSVNRPFAPLFLQVSEDILNHHRVFDTYGYISIEIATGCFGSKVDGQNTWGKNRIPQISIFFLKCS